MKRNGKHFRKIEPNGYFNPFDDESLQTVNTFYCRYGKRIFDFSLAFIIVIITLPLNLVLAIITFLDVGWPILFVQLRPGLAERPIPVFKFRNMTNETDENGELLPAIERITKFGKLMRRTSLDELLQFWLILVGKMSIIGPRPLLMEYLPKYSLQQHKRHAVRPGLECPLWDNSWDNRDWNVRINNDVWYVENISFKTDCAMFFRLIRTVLSKNRAKVRGESIYKKFESDKTSNGSITQ